MRGVQSHFMSAAHPRIRTFRRLAAGLLVGVTFVTAPRDASPSGTNSPGLACGGGAKYPAGVAQTNATGFGSPTCNRRTTAVRRYFFVRTPLRASICGWALAGRASALPVSYCAGLPTLPCARPPHLEVGSGLNPAIGGRTMLRQSPLAHTGQNSSLIQLIISDALRAAATVDTYQSALDVTGAALVAISALVRAEVRNG